MSVTFYYIQKANMHTVTSHLLEYSIAEAGILLEPEYKCGNSIFVYTCKKYIYIKETKKVVQKWWICHAVSIFQSDEKSSL